MMYLTQDQASIAMYQESRLRGNDIPQEVAKLKSHSSGQYAVMLSTGCKLKFDTEMNKFYLDGYVWLDVDCIYIYDSLEILEDYWEYLRDDLDFSEESIESRKRSYEGYKASIEYQVA